MPPHASPVSRRSSDASAPMRSASLMRGYSAHVTAHPSAGSNESPKRTFPLTLSARIVHSTRFSLPAMSSHTNFTPSGRVSRDMRAACEGSTCENAEKSSERVRSNANRSHVLAAEKSVPFAARTPVMRPLASSSSSARVEDLTAAPRAKNAQDAAAAKSSPVGRFISSWALPA